MRYVLALILALRTSITDAAPAAHAVLRLGNVNGNAVLFSCLSDSDLNKRAADEGNHRPFGWQWQSQDFRCKEHPSPIAAMSAECTYQPDDAHFIDFFFTTPASCASFEAELAPHCKDEPAADCLTFLEDRLRVRGANTDPI